MAQWSRTHETLQRAALELFKEQGYEATATAQVARRAGVSEVTLFRHFVTKEALLLDDPFDPMLAQAVRARPEGEPAMRALAEGIRQALGSVDVTVDSDQRDRLRILAATPALRGAIERNNAQTVMALTDALVDRGEPRATAQVAAASVMAGLSAALLDWAGSERAPLADVLDAALTVLGGR